MKIYLPNNSQQKVGGGWTFVRNLKAGLSDRVEFVDNYKDADVILIMGVTTVEIEELEEAKKLGKKIILRVDNVPRNSRNLRCRPKPYEKLKLIAELYADAVVYQSEWSKMYAGPLCGDGMIIYNGVDTKIFNPKPELKKEDRYLYVYHSRGNDLKGFWEAHYYFQMMARKNPDAEFWIINNLGNETADLIRANLDFWNDEKWSFLGVVNDPVEMAKIMQKCSHLIFPASVESCPNTVLEALACGLQVVAVKDNFWGGTSELLNLPDISLETMCDEYFNLFELVHSGDFEITNSAV